MAKVVIVGGFVLVGVSVAPPGRTDLDPLGYALALAAPLALGVLRRAPALVLLFVTACMVGYFVRGYPGVNVALPLMVSLFVAVKSGHRRLVLAPPVGLVIVILADLRLADGAAAREIVEDRFLLAGWLVASAMMGAAFRQWGAYVHEVERRAAEAERTREEVAARRAGEERLRIARELHDSLTHSISIIKVQTGVAIHLARKRGERVPEALLAVQEAGSDAMRELRATLGVLRDDAERHGSGLRRLPDLVERARSAGLSAEVTVSGAERTLPGEVDRAAYRIVQEALTNVSRHARSPAARVLVEYGPDALTVQVEDDGAGAVGRPSPAPGVGLTGMRERVAALGGRLHAGPRPEGGFTVRAELPLHDAGVARPPGRHGALDAAEPSVPALAMARVRDEFTANGHAGRGRRDDSGGAGPGPRETR